MTPGAWTAIAVIAVLGLVLLCCVPVTIVGGYLAFRENAGGPGLPININKVTRENFNRITDGMTPAQVEEILGRGQPVAGQQDLFEWRASRVTIRVGFVNGRVNRRSIVERN